jgi:hypothetical protein
MRRLLFTLLLLLLLSSLSLPLSAQSHVFCASDSNCTYIGNNTFTGTTTFTGSTLFTSPLVAPLCSYTVSNLPTNFPTNTVCIATDANPTCLIGGGTITPAICQYNGSTWTTIATGGVGGGGVWGSITGTLSSQTDLQSALNAKANINANTTGTSGGLSGSPSISVANVTASGTVSDNSTLSATHPVFDVTSPIYGAVANYNPVTQTGTDNDAAFESAAFAAAAVGGVVYVPPGNYLLNSIPTGASNPNSNASYINASGNGLAIKCDPGAAIYGGPTQFNGTTPGTGGGYIYPTVFYLDQTGIEDVAYATPATSPNPAYPIAPITISGATSLTASTPANAGNFAVGDQIYLQGNLNQDCTQNGELDWVVSANASTGVITLKYPLIKAYLGSGGSSACANGNQGDSTHPWAGIVKATGQFYNKVTIDSCEVHASGDFSSIGQVTGVQITNNKYYWGGLSTRGMFMNSFPPIYDIEMSRNTIQDGWLQVAEGQQNFRIHHNLWSVNNRSNANTNIGISEGAMNVDISHNVFSLNATTANGIAFSLEVQGQAFGLNISDNFISEAVLNTTGVAASGISILSGAALPCVNCVINHNIITMTSVASSLANVVGIDAKTTNLSITDNTISGANTAIQDVTSGAVVRGNRINLATPCPANNCRGIIVESISGGGGHDATIVGNTVNGGAAASNVYGIDLNPDGQYTNSALIVGNRFSNLGYPISYTANVGSPTYWDAPLSHSNQCDSTITTPGNNCDTTMTTGGLADWNNSGIASGDVAQWNGSQWTPVPLPSFSSAVVASVGPALLTGTTGIALTTLYTPSAAGEYRMCVAQNVTVAASAGSSEYAYFTYTTDGHGVTQTTGVGTITMTTQWSTGNGCVVFYADASQPIKYGVSYTTVTGTPSIRYAFTLEAI